MPVPDFQSLMLPVLKALSDGSDVQIAEACARVAAAEGLTPDDLLERTRGAHPPNSGACCGGQCPHPE